jgi:hypothetical protein
VLPPSKYPVSKTGRNCWLLPALFIFLQFGIVKNILKLTFGVIYNTMKIITTPEKFAASKSRDLIALECYHCKSTFEKPKNYVQACIKNIKRNGCGNYCCLDCSRKAISASTRINTKCKECEKPISRTKSSFIGVKNVFCGQRCSGLYNAKHKTTGNRRSKLELWLETKLTNLYPNVKFIFNDTSAIQAELDIYIPELNIAFELNGKFHYEKIFSNFERTQERDRMKVSLCATAGIGLCVIDTSRQKYFKESSSEEFLVIIKNIIQERLTEKL